MDAGPQIAPATDRLIRSLLALCPPHQGGLAFATSLLDRRGELEDEAERAAAWFAQAGGDDNGRTATAWATVFRRLWSRTPGMAAQIVAKLRAQWPAPTPLQADLLRLGDATVELSAARDAGALSGPGIGVLTFLLDPIRPPVWDARYATTITHRRQGHPAAELVAELEALRPRLPTLDALCGSELDALLRQLRVEGGP